MLLGESGAPDFDQFLYHLKVQIAYMWVRVCARWGVLFAPWEAVFG